MADPAERLDDVLAVRHRPYVLPPAYVLSVIGSVEPWNAKALAAQFGQASAGRTVLVVDLHELVFGGWDLIGVLLDARSRHPAVVLVGPLPPLLCARFAVTGAGALFPVAPTLAEALVASVP
ncbi:hypothetical protein [Streptomyces cremeus]|uniref:Anti-sigma factor antagonist n=1 Tax=Streptomyces cremeus TaxID=66881 RepID=A0ABV5PDX6_STRCM